MKKLRVFLLANSEVGLKIAKYLVNRENIVALGIHNPDKQRNTDKIIATVNVEEEHVFQAKDLRDLNTLEKIKELKPDIIVCAFWGYILKEQLLSIPPLGSINFHPGFLPYNRGMNPNVWPFIEGTPAGVTIHYVDEGIDTGRIIAQKKIKIASTDTAGDVELKTWKEIVALFKSIWSKLKNNTIEPIKQDARKATFHWAKDIASLDKIDLDKKYKARDLLNLLRARTYKKHSFSYFEENGEKIFIKIKLNRDKTHYKQRIESILHKLKYGVELDVPSILPVYRDGKHTANLRVIDKKMLAKASTIKLLAKWRLQSQDAFPSQFTVTEEGTKKWGKDQLLDTSDRILFFLETVEGKPYAHMGLFRFDYKKKTCEIDNVLRGDDIMPGSMTDALDTLIKWTFEKLHINRLYIQVFSDNKKAVNLYKRCGFKGVRKNPLRKVVAPGVIKFIDITDPKQKPDRYFLIMKLDNEL